MKPRFFMVAYNRRVTFAIVWMLTVLRTEALDTVAGQSAPVCPSKQGVLIAKQQHCPIPLDDTSTSALWHPWTFRPYCITENKRGDKIKLLVDKKDSAQDDLKQRESVQITRRTNNVKYCLYTNSFFGDTGISILARPEAAASAAGMIQDLYHSGFPSPETVQHLNLEPAFKVVDMPEKGGKGVVSTRRIKKLDTFMVDYASIIGDLNMWGSVSQIDGQKILDKAAEQLADPERVLTLSRSVGGGGAVEGVIRANTFRTHLEGVPQKALFPKISRVNHACKPNAMIRFSDGGLMAGLAAYRDIEAGEEITISYIPLTDSSEQRKEKLRAWGFTCTCHLCTAPAAQTRASDDRRTKLTQGIPLMIESIQKGDLRGAIGHLVKALQYLEEEDLESVSGDIHESLARIYWLAGDKKTGRELARKAVDYRTDFGTSLGPRNRTADVEDMLADF